MPLFDEDSQRIRGEGNQEAAETALARVKVASDSDSAGTTSRERWLVAKVCSEYLQYCERGVANKTLSKGHRDNAVAWLNDLCGYCGAVPVGKVGVDPKSLRELRVRTASADSEVVSMGPRLFSRGNPHDVEPPRLAGEDASMGPRLISRGNGRQQPAGTQRSRTSPGHGGRSFR
jgi:hypothetical protein